jgi:hypothetical protein
MSVVLLGILFVTSLTVSMTYGIGRTFAVVYLPALLLFYPVTPMELAYAPDIDAQSAVMYGVLIASTVDGFTAFRFRWRVPDWIVLALSGSAVVTAVVTEQVWTGVSELGYQTLEWALPYFVARSAFYDARLRGLALRMLVVIACVHAGFGLVEMRLWPHTYEWLLSMFQLCPAPSRVMAMQRWGFFRAESALRHPIYFGNMCLTMLGLIVALSWLGGGMSRLAVRAGATAALVGLVTSLSFGPFGGAVACAATLGVVYFARWTDRFLGPAAIAVVAIMLAFTVRTATTPLGPKPDDGTLAASYYTRQLIIRNSWDMATTAGPFGHGKRIDKSQLDLESVDNAYLLYALTRGWVYVGLWIALPVTASFVGTRALSKCRNDRERFPVAVCVATTMGVAMAMYAVWAGWHGMPGTLLWAFGIALLVTVDDMLGVRATTALPRATAGGTPSKRRMARGPRRQSATLPNVAPQGGPT